MNHNSEEVTVNDFAVAALLFSTVIYQSLDDMNRSRCRSLLVKLIRVLPEQAPPVSAAMPYSNQHISWLLSILLAYCDSDHPDQDLPF